jgi:hypothetical protein
VLSLQSGLAVLNRRCTVALHLASTGVLHPSGRRCGDWRSGTAVRRRGSRPSRMPPKPACSTAKRRAGCGGPETGYIRSDHEFRRPSPIAFETVWQFKWRLAPLATVRRIERLPAPERWTYRGTFNRAYDRYQHGGPCALADRPPWLVWMYNRIPEAQRDGILDSTLARPESPLRKLVVRFAGQKRYFVSEAFVYRLLRVHDTITGAAFNVVAVVEEFHAKTTKRNQLWQADFTNLAVIGRRRFYPSTFLDGF